MSFHPRVSVIVPTYNRVDSLLKVIDAIVEQSYPAAEIIVADDGSTDHTVAVLSGRNISNLKLIALDHSGLPAVARNAALSHATGDWVAFCDSDDIWAPNRLAEQVSRRTPGSRALCSNAWVTGPKNDRARMFERMPDFLSLERLLKRNWIINSSVLIEKDLLVSVGGIAHSPNLRGIEDYATWLRVSSVTEFQSISEPLVTYRDNAPDSLRGQREFEKVLNQADAWIDFLAWMRSRGRPLTISETAIAVGIPKLIATNMRLIRQNQR